MKGLTTIVATAIILAGIPGGCKPGAAGDTNTWFTQVNEESSGIGFINSITESDSLNVFVDEYMYNGSGIGVGDFNNDGLPDLFFAGSMVSCRLYLNKGNFRFEDITVPAGLVTSQWCTGVAVADINGDGLQDIYVSSSHARQGEKRKNLLFINQGDLRFSEEAERYGLADTGFSTQAAFFDMDNDGDLDLYVLNHRLYSDQANNIQPKDRSGNSPAQDRLYRNDGLLPGNDHPVFTDISLQAGIQEDGYGLGITVTDVNQDQWPDLYIANDYIGNDLLWLNNGDGSFTNVMGESIRHQSYNSMGVDAADINNDLLPDIMTLDMLPETNERKKMMFSAAGQEKYDMQARFGYEPSYMRNMLQLNNGTRMIKGKRLPFYSEIGQWAGVAETDWSWSVLLADIDNDGWKDIYITNGLGKDVTNNDYASFRNNEGASNNYTFDAGNNSMVRPSATLNITAMRKEIDAYGAIRMKNYFFHNDGGTVFSDMSAQAGGQTPSISNGAVYSDLDNDGDLDLVISNIDQPAFLLKNEIRHSVKDSGSNFISVDLHGPEMNTNGLGARLICYTRNGRQLLEQSPVRGFSSSVDGRLHFGLGAASSVDSLIIYWPNGKRQTLGSAPANQFLRINYEDTGESGTFESAVLPGKYLLPIQWPGVEFTHTETVNYDFGSRQPLLQKYSQLGPCLAVADLNGDGREDFFAGGAANQSGRIFLQQANGSFQSRELTAHRKPGEDLGAAFFDADQDGDADLLITGGSLEFGVEKYNQPGLYLNDGKGNFNESAAALPSIHSITKAIAVADMDGDGDLDLFIGGRLLPGKYPESPRSYLLRNDNGKFTDVTAERCTALSFPGMIEAALFSDYDGDGDPDLLIAGEWMEPRFFQNAGGQFREATAATGLQHLSGWWRSVEPADLDQDGDIDFVIGNIGMNTIYRASAAQPLQLFVSDMDKNGVNDLVPAYYMRNATGGYEQYPVPDRNQLADQVPVVKKKYLLHKEYSVVSMDRLQKDFPEGSWRRYSCETTASLWLENTGHGKFRVHELPGPVQWAPVNAILITDINKDGMADLVLAGNEYQSAAAIGRYDASYGSVLIAKGRGEFEPVGNRESGLLLDGDIKALKLVHAAGKKIMIAAPNNASLITSMIK